MRICSIILVATVIIYSMSNKFGKTEYFAIVCCGYNSNILKLHRLIIMWQDQLQDSNYWSEDNYLEYYYYISKILWCITSSLMMRMMVSKVCWMWKSLVT